MSLIIFATDSSTSYSVIDVGLSILVPSHSNKSKSDSAQRWTNFSVSSFLLPWNLKSAVLFSPFAFLSLSNLSKHFCVSDSPISSCGFPGFINSAALLAAALPKTTRSIKELEPNLLAPWTDTHAASPIAIKPGTVFSDPLTVKTSSLPTPLPSLISIDIERLTTSLDAKSLALGAYLSINLSPFAFVR